MEPGGEGNLEVALGATPTDVELRAARRLAALGYRVVLRPPVGRRSPMGSTSDLLVNGLPYDIYSPRSRIARNIVGELAHKGSQAYGVVLDLSRTPVTSAVLGDILQRARRAGSRLQDVIVLD